MLILLLCPCHAACAQEQSTIRVATLKNFPPQYSLTEKGTPTGFAVDIINQVAKLANLTPEYLLFANWNEAQQALKDGTVDVIPNMGITPRRKRFAAFTAPVETLPVSIFTRATDHSINSLQDLKGKKVAVAKLNVGYVLLKDRKDIELIIAATASEAIMLLLSGQTDALVFPRPVIESLARKSRISDRFKVAGTPLEEISRGIATSKDNPELRNRLDRAVRHLVATDRYRELYSKWYGSPEPFWTAGRLYIASGMALAIFLGSLFLMRDQSLASFNKDLEQRIKERTELLEVSEKNTRLLFEKSFLGIAEHRIVYDHEGQATDYTIINVNPAFYKILEIEEETAINRKASDLYGTDEAPFLAEYVTAVEMNRPKELEREFEPLEKTFRIFVYSHKPGCFVTLFEDITQRRTHERKAKEQEQFIKSLLSAIPIPVFYKDRDGRYMGCNKAFTEMIGPSSEEIAGKTVFDLAPAKTAKIYHQKDMELLANPAHQRYESEIITKDGTTRPVIFAKDVFYDQHGEAVGLIGAFMDITDRRVAELALQKSEEKYRQLFTELSRAHEELNQYAYVVSHDLKSPLRAISNYSTFITEDMAEVEMPKQVSGHLKGLSKAVTQCVELVDDLLELSQIGRTNTELIEIDVNNILVDIVESLKLPHSTTISIAEDIPPVAANPVMLRQIFANLINNAIKFNNSPQQSVELTGQVLPDSRVEIVVRDNGIGIAEQYHQQIFKVFQRLHTQEEYEGSGIGLAIVKKSAEVMDGSIQLKSTPGQGSVFMITLPSASSLSKQSETPERKNE